jgi:thiol-disulfide isomerase/thioredoxin
MTKTSIILIAVVALGACARPRPKLPAPEAGIPVLLQSTQTTVKSLSELRGQVVVLEFWATWCGPCLELLPHMNKMVDSFAGQRVRFISVTDEERPVVEAYLAKHAMKAEIGLDPEQAAFRAFKVDSRPEVFVIDPYGRIWIKIHPSFLYKSDIEDALKAAPPRPAA